jgi:hypothetical protein
MNNFVAESYPKFREQMALAYNQDLDFEIKAKEKAGQKLGYQPRFMQAGFEYIKQWFREVQNQEFELTQNLPEDVRGVVDATLPAAQDSWWRYPSRQEADTSEELITRYARASYEINNNQVWPEFKKLVEQDMEDQKAQELLQDLEKGKPKDEDQQAGQGLPQELKDKLNPAEQKELEDALEQAIKSNGAGKDSGQESGQQPQAGEGEQKKPAPSKAVNLDSLSEKLKQKIKEYIESLPEEKKKELAARAQAAIKEFEKDLNEELQGKLSSNPEIKAERDAAKTEEPKPEAAKEDGEAQVSAGERITGGRPSSKPADVAGMRVFTEQMAKEIKADANDYEKYRREVIPLIEKLEEDLRRIFVERQAQAWKGGNKTGKRIDVKRRIQEKAKGISAMESKAWQKRELPKENDYAITLLVDVSGSMFWDEKSKESLKSIIVLAEVLNRLGVNVEILGFSDELKEYQSFGEAMSNSVREKIGKILPEVEAKRCDVCKLDHNATDVGWATQVAAERLAQQKAENKFLITLSDFQLEESPKHPADKFDLGKMVKQVLKNTDVKMIGLEIGDEKGPVDKFYPNSLAKVKAKDMGEKLAGLIERVIANYEEF